MLLDLIKQAVRQLFGQSKVIKQFQARVLELETINEGLRNAHELDSVSLRKAAEAAAVDVASANAKAEDMKAQLAVLEGASNELLAAINDHPETPIYDEEYNLLAQSGVPAVSEFPASMTPEEIAQVEAEAANAPQVPTNLGNPTAEALQAAQDEIAPAPVEVPAVEVQEWPDVIGSGGTLEKVEGQVFPLEQVVNDLVESAQEGASADVPAQPEQSE